MSNVGPHAGTRLLAVAMSGLCLPLPLVSQLAMQLYSLLMVRKNDSLCSTQLMADPLTISRVRAFNLATTGTFLPPVGAVFAQWQLSDRFKCSLYITLLHLFGGVLCPMLPLALSRDDGTASLRRRMKMEWVWAMWLCMQALWMAAVLMTMHLE